MRHLFTVILLVLQAASAGAADVAPQIETQATYLTREAGRDAIDRWVRDFVAERPNSGRIAVLPLVGDLPDGYFAETLRNAFARHSAGPATSVFTRDEAVSTQLLDEIRRGDRLGDAMEVETIQKFGRISGVDLLVVSRVAGVVADPEWESPQLRRLLGQTRRLSVRMLGSVYEVETGRMLWGGERVGSAPFPEAPWRVPGSPRAWGVTGVSVACLGLVCAVFGAVRRRYRPL